MLYIDFSKEVDSNAIGNLVSDGINFETVSFRFSKNWDGYLKTAVFSDENAVYSVVLQPGNPLCVNENECYIPFEVLKPGIFYLSVFGTKGNSRATTKSVPVRVLKSGYAEGQKPSEPTLTQYEQLVNLATEIKAIAQSVRDDADNGSFKGDSYSLTEGDKTEIAAIVSTDMEKALEGIIAIQNLLIGGGSV